MKTILLLGFILLISCSSSEENKEETSFDEKLSSIWDEIKTDNTTEARSTIDALIQASNDSSQLSLLNNAKGWTFFLEGNGLKNDQSYMDSFTAFSLSGEQDSYAGVAIVGQLIESYTSSLEASERFLDLNTYSHHYSIEGIKLNAVLLNGGWSAYFLKEWTKTKIFLDKLDPSKTHEEIPDSLFSDLKRITL